MAFWLDHRYHLVKVLTYQSCNHTGMPPHTPKAFDAWYITRIPHYRIIFQTCNLLYVSIQKVLNS